ncbi:MAG TPA: four helix bundle protein [Flavobacteriaceae bacterium]|nr:four helix bundle protein [Flavobacteriaceae bacterium]
MKKYTQFEDLNVYKDALAFFVRMTNLLRENKYRTEFAVKDQLRRASLSILNNIAEGFERETDKELVRFLFFAKGSAGEVRNMMNVLKEMNYITEDDYLILRKEIIYISQ